MRVYTGTREMGGTPPKMLLQLFKTNLKANFKDQRCVFISNKTIKISWFDVDQTKMIAQFFAKVTSDSSWQPDRHGLDMFGGILVKKKCPPMPVFSPAKWHLLKMPKGICLAGFSSCFCWNKIDIWMKRLRRTCVLLFLNCYPGVSVEKAPPITGMDYYCYCSRTEKFMTFPAILFCHFQCVWPFP